MEGGRGARRQGTLSSSTGCSWASFEEKAKDYELKSGLLGPSRNPFSPTTRQLCREGLSLYNTKIHPHHDICYTPLPNVYTHCTVSTLLEPVDYVCALYTLYSCVDV
jgi:hypothetical protein